MHTKHQICLDLALKLAILNIIRFQTTSGECQMSLIYHLNYGYGHEVTCNKTSIEELSQTLANNEISLKITDSHLKLDKGTFKNLRKVRILNIERSQIEFASNNTFSELKNLKTLTLCKINLKTIPPYFFKGLEGNLNLLNLTSNSLRLVEKSSLGDLKGIKTVILNNNEIRSFKDLNLCDLNIQKLYLSNNRIDSLNRSEIMNCFRVLELLDLSSNRLKLLEGFVSDTLNKLDLSNNSLSEIKLLETVNLSDLNLENNNLSVIDNSLGKVPNLIRLNLSNNSLRLVNVSRYDLIKYLDLSKNNLTNKFSINLNNLVSLNLSNNNISSFDVDYGHRKAINESKLEKVDLSFNNFTELSKSTFVDFANLEEINLSHNSLKKFDLQFKEKCNLSKLNLSHNCLVEVENLDNLGELLELDLSFNRIQRFNESTFKNLENLESLNLSNNLLEQLDYKLVEPLENLQLLDVDGNLLHELDYSSIISELPKLDAFKVKNNLLTCEFLTKMIRYFKDYEINFSLNEHLDIDKENVAGIYCKETENKLNALKETQMAIKNNTKVLKELYAEFNKDSKTYRLTFGQIAVLVVGLVFLAAVLVLITQRAFIWYKRKHYLVDELELIHNEPYKRLG